MKLFCFPYAGGSSRIFSSWDNLLRPEIDLISVELAGRGSRFDEPQYESLEEAIDDLFGIVSEQLQGGEYAFFGHSMGAMLAYEIAQRISKIEMRQPSHLFFSGRGAPNIKDDRFKSDYLLNDADFRSRLEELGGTPPEFFDYPELVELFIPILRNDFKIVSESLRDKKIDPFNCDLSIFLGKNEDITCEQAYAWRKHTCERCSIHCLNGEHFILNDNLDRIIEIIKYELK